VVRRYLLVSGVREIHRHRQAWTIGVAVCLAALAGWYAINGLLVLFPGAGWSHGAQGSRWKPGRSSSLATWPSTWNATGWPVRIVLSGVVMLAVLTNAGAYSALVLAHEPGHTAAVIELNRDAVPLAQQIAIEEGAVRDLDVRVAHGDDIVRAVTAKRHARTASNLAPKQDKTCAQLVTLRQAIAERIAKLKEEQAGIEARKARTAAELGPALAIARLFGSSDVDGAIAVVCPLLVWRRTRCHCCWWSRHRGVELSRQSAKTAKTRP